MEINKKKDKEKIIKFRERLNKKFSQQMIKQEVE